MNTALRNSACFLVLAFGTVTVAAQPVLWPIDRADSPDNQQNPLDGESWRTVNCSFGELHGSLQNGRDRRHFHSAVDIDTASGIFVRAVESGRILAQDDNGVFGCSEAERMVTLEHPPIVNNQYTRRSVYRHIDPDCNNLGHGDPVAAYTELGTVGNRNGEGHLHIELWQQENNVWKKLNPLGNEIGWQLRYHQTLEGRPDRYDPQINDIYINSQTGQTQPGQQANAIASGYSYDHNTAIGLSERVVDNVTYCRVHLADTTPVSNFSVAPLVQYPNDRLILFGNIGLTANIRDVGINSNPGGANTSSGQGVTIRQMYYSIEGEQINVPNKYEIDFNTIRLDQTRGAANLVHVFDLGFDPAHLRYGNNDFIKLWREDDSYLSPYPNALIGQVQSNGIWFTKARAETEHIFRYTPDEQHVARCTLPEEAKYPDGDYTLTFFAQDDWGRVNRAANAADVNAKVTVIVDNFLPFVRKVEVFSGETLISSREWTWQNGTLTFGDLPADLTDKQADQAQPLRIVVTTSEPLALTTDHVS